MECYGVAGNPMPACNRGLVVASRQLRHATPPVAAAKHQTEERLADANASCYWFLCLPGRAEEGFVLLLHASSQSGRVVLCHAFFSFAWRRKHRFHIPGEEAFLDNAC
jgi:hypothetical protein